MLFSKLLNTMVDALWRASGLGTATDLNLDEFGSGAYAPCPRESEYPCCSNLEASPCPLRSSIFSPMPPSR